MTEPDTSINQRLTGPELRVVNLAAVGLENSEIADKLGMSKFKVKRRLRAVKGKLNTHSTHYRVILAHFALHEGLPNLFDRSNRKTPCKL